MKAEGVNTKVLGNPAIEDFAVLMDGTDNWG